MGQVKNLGGTLIPILWTFESIVVNCLRYDRMESNHFRRALEYHDMQAEYYG